MKRLKEWLASRLAPGLEEVREPEIRFHIKGDSIYVDMKSLKASQVVRDQARLARERYSH